MKDFYLPGHLHEKNQEAIVYDLNNFCYSFFNKSVNWSVLLTWNFQANWLYKFVKSVQMDFSFPPPFFVYAWTSKCLYTSIKLSKLKPDWVHVRFHANVLYADIWIQPKMLPGPIIVDSSGLPSSNCWKSILNHSLK